MIGRYLGAIEAELAISNHSESAVLFLDGVLLALDELFY